MRPYEGHDADFTDNPRGPSPRPNDFMSYFVTEEDAEWNWIITGANHEAMMKLRPYIARQMTTTGFDPFMMVRLKVGVNLRDIRDVLEPIGGSFGKDRPVQMC
jgi:hypothetical protein